ncbi:helix-turn-helix domain-containing protein [Flavobacterium cerinum]|uniref:XRE family transcriptional regulator n=1 Tax=Flavobacterium cerinum TaxID=2502784 RepID=A0A444H077_9FLAO|nr:helix-turn-helix transcriptional regulator [Flavobacterium cerinum]RWW96627.1 XRE family transcriptional regulator [Flavobacterium cerinum]
MVNTDDFIKRLEIILDYYSYSASVFADKMGVQRSGLSHLLSGRNKPSLDFVMKIVENFPEVDLYWLLQGTGSFPKKEDSGYRIPDTSFTPTSQPEETKIDDPFTEKKESVQIPDLFNLETKSSTLSVSKEKNIERIVVFYADGTFKSYSPENKEPR